MLAISRIILFIVDDLPIYDIYIYYIGINVCRLTCAYHVLRGAGSESCDTAARLLLHPVTRGSSSDETPAVELEVMNDRYIMICNLITT